MSLSKLECNTARMAQATLQNIFRHTGNRKEGQGEVGYTVDFNTEDGQAAAMLQKLKPTETCSRIEMTG